MKKNYTGRKLIYTMKPIRELNGKVTRGAWVPAIDPEGDYGGPYSNWANLWKNPKYKRNTAELMKLQKEYYAAENERRRTRRSGSRGQRRSRSRGSR
jgi:hypothetical protein